MRKFSADNSQHILVILRGTDEGIVVCQVCPELRSKWLVPKGQGAGGGKDGSRDFWTRFPKARKIRAI